MAVQFCEACGNLSITSPKQVVKCDCCGRECKNLLLNSITVSSASDFPGDLRSKRSTVQKMPKMSATDTWAAISERCPACGADEVKYTALQLRSADEGTTMFYYCSNCEKRWKEDN